MKRFCFSSCTQLELVIYFLFCEHVNKYNEICPCINRNARPNNNQLYSFCVSLFIPIEYLQYLWILLTIFSRNGSLSLFWFWGYKMTSVSKHIFNALTNLFYGFIVFIWLLFAFEENAQFLQLHLKVLVLHFCISVIFYFLILFYWGCCSIN